VAPSGNQTATEKTNINLKRSEKPVYSPAISIDLNLPEPGHVAEQVEKGLPSFVLDEDIVVGLATIHDMIVRAGVLDS
jgi:hypothetical protein